jgi:hypothetical protein
VLDAALHRGSGASDRPPDGGGHYCLLAFETTHNALTARRHLRGLALVTMPVLREISSGCGIALRLPPADMEAAWVLLDRAGMAEGAYRCYRVTHANGGIAVLPLLRGEALLPAAAQANATAPEPAWSQKEGRVDEHERADAPERPHVQGRLSRQTGSGRA